MTLISVPAFFLGALGLAMPASSVGDRVKLKGEDQVGYVTEVIVKVRFPKEEQMCKPENLEQEPAAKKRKAYELCLCFPLEA